MAWPMSLFPADSLLRTRSVQNVLAGLAFAAGVMVAGCGDRELPAAAYGARLFRDPNLSTSPFNVASCATCHAVDPAAPPVSPGRFDPGYNLGNAAGRPSWWGGYETRLLDALNTCLEHFMGGRRLSSDDPRGRALYDYIEANSPEAVSAAVPFTVVRTVTSLASLAGDATRGAEVFLKACTRCHGKARTAEGRLTPRATILPDDTIKNFPENARAAVVEKVRHGRFLSLTGTMPLYSLEALSDEHLADLLAYLGL
jgi:thiosulfate dehydrogenase